MLQSFIIILREGFESFLLVAVIFSYLRKSGRRQLASAVYSGIGVALIPQAASRLQAPSRTTARSSSTER